MNSIGFVSYSAFLFQIYIIYKIAPSPLVVGSTAADILQPTDVFRAKNDNIKELDVNRGKLAKTKTDPSMGVAKPTTPDLNAIQNINKINNNALETSNENNADRVFKTNIVRRTPNEVKPTLKPTSAANANDVANKSNNNIATVTAPKNTTKESTKKKSKEKDQKAAEEKRRQQEEEEEKKRLELIAAQRKAKLVDQNAPRAEQAPKRNNLAASVGKFQ